MTALRNWLVVLMCVPSPVLAQDVAPDFPRSLDLEIAHLTFSWRWTVEQISIGPELGVGVLQQKTLAPHGDDLTSLVHIGLASGLPFSETWSGEVGVRLGAGELRSLYVQGDLFDGYVAATAAVFGGRHRFQGGTRLMVGRASDRAASNTFVAWSPLILRLRF